MTILVISQMMMSNLMKKKLMKKNKTLICSKLSNKLNLQIILSNISLNMSKKRYQTILSPTIKNLKNNGLNMLIMFSLSQKLTLMFIIG